MDNTAPATPPAPEQPTPTRAQTLRAHLDQLRNPPASESADQTGEAQNANQTKTPEPQAQQSQPVIVFYDGSTPLPDERAENMVQLVVAGWVPWRAYKAAFKVDIKQNSCYERVSVLRKGTDYSKREGWLIANKPKPHEVGVNPPVEQAQKQQLPQKMVDSSPDADVLDASLIKKVLKRALAQHTIDAVTMSAVGQAMKVLKLGQDDVGAPDPGAIAAWLATDHTDKTELDAILSELGRMYRVHISISSGEICK